MQMIVLRRLAIGRRLLADGPSGGAGSRSDRPAESGREPIPDRISRARPISGLELRYRHLVPDPEQWDADPERPASCSRTAAVDAHHRLLLVQHQPDGRGTPACSDEPAWDQRPPGSSPTGCGDLTLSATTRGPRRSGGKVRFELDSREAFPTAASIDLATGDAILSRGDQALLGQPPTIKGRVVHTLPSPTSTTGMTLLVDGTTRRRRRRELRDPETNPGRRPPADLVARRDRRRGGDGRGERPCPETRYLLYPVPRSASTMEPSGNVHYPRSAASSCLDSFPTRPSSACVQGAGRMSTRSGPRTAS